MKAPNAGARPGKSWMFFLSAVVLAGIAIVVVEPFQAAKSEIAAATYTRGVLRVTIPYHADHSGDGKLSVEVLDPEDKVLGRTEKDIAIGEGNGHWQEEIRFDKAPAADDLVWHRLRYRYEYTDRKTAAIGGTESISQILRTPVVHILGQQSYLTRKSHKGLRTTR
jgi:hypothetical protein